LIDFVPVPVTLRVLIEGRKHNGEDNLHIITDKVAEVLVVPEIKGSFGNLEVRAGDGFSQLVEQRLLNLSKLSRVHDFKNVLYFVEEHDLLCAVYFGPVA